MKHTILPTTHHGITLRLAAASDIDRYYADSFVVQDSESTYLTGSEDSYPQDAVDRFLLASVTAPDRYLLLLIDSNKSIIGESVLNCIDYDNSCCNYRIIIWNSHYRNRGIGTWALSHTLAIAFEVLQLDTVTLDVYSFNPRAQAVYQKAGFVATHTTDDAPPDADGNPAQEIHMQLTHQQWIDQQQQ